MATEKEKPLQKESLYAILLEPVCLTCGGECQREALIMNPKEK